MKTLLTLLLAGLTTLAMGQVKITGKVVDQKSEAVIGSNGEPER